MDINSFTHWSTNENGKEECVIELRKSLVSRIFKRNHILTFEKRPEGWCHKDSGRPASDTEYLTIYGLVNFGHLPC